LGILGVFKAIRGVSGGHFGGVLGRLKRKTNKNLQPDTPQKYYSFCSKQGGMPEFGGFGRDIWGIFGGHLH